MLSREPEQAFEPPYRCRALLLTIANKQLGWVDRETTGRATMVLLGFGLAVISMALAKQMPGGHLRLRTH